MPPLNAEDKPGTPVGSAAIPTYGLSPPESHIRSPNPRPWLPTTTHAAQSSTGRHLGFFLKAVFPIPTRKAMKVTYLPVKSVQNVGCQRVWQAVQSQTKDRIICMPLLPCLDRQQGADNQVHGAIISASSEIQISYTSSYAAQINTCAKAELLIQWLKFKISKTNAIHKADSNPCWWQVNIWKVEYGKLLSLRVPGIKGCYGGSNLCRVDPLDDWFPKGHSNTKRCHENLAV